MAVQQNKKSRARRDKGRSHIKMKKPEVSEDPVSGERHRRHHATADGYYRGRKIFETQQEISEEE